MRLNIHMAPSRQFTHEGAPASRLTPLQELRRSVLSCLLWEDTFYENGKSIAERIAENAAKVDPHSLANLAIEARQSFHLRHVPLLLLTILAKTGAGIPRLTRDTVEAVISRPDELGELLSIYWKDGKTPLAHGLQKGLRQAMTKFDAFQFWKWNRDSAIKIRDVAFITHATFPDLDRQMLMANMVNRTFFPEKTKGGFELAKLGLEGDPRKETPETWEALIAAAGSNREVRRGIWEELLKRALNRQSGGFGYMAILRNLRNMTADDVNAQLIEMAIEARIGAKRVLPFRFVQAAKITPQFFRSLDTALKASIVHQEPMPGITVLVVDCSGSMTTPLSQHGQVSRLDAAAALAGCVHGQTRLIAFGHEAREVKPVPGLACVDILQSSGVGHSTNAHLGVMLANQMKPLPDRIIIITDEQVSQSLPSCAIPAKYIINVGPYKNGIGFGEWTKIDGFSASTLDYIREFERGAELI
jgi:60 kDa SS-A/Ro ribonucleoprotein